MEYIYTDPVAVVHVERAIQGMGKDFVSAVLLDGPAGAGKTSMVKHVAKKIGASLLQWQMFPGADRHDLLFDKDPMTGERIPGILVNAIRQSELGPSILLLDELDKADVRVDSFLLNFLQEGVLNLPQLGNLKVNTKNLLVFFTKNDLREASGPLMRRCRVVYMDWPSESIETQILFDSLPLLTHECCEVVFEFSSKLRRNPQVRKAPSTPELVRICEDLLWLASIPSIRANPTMVGRYFANALTPLHSDRHFIEKGELYIGISLLEAFIPAIKKASDLSSLKTIVNCLHRDDLEKLVTSKI